jgi:uncharacterized membrane protein
MEGAARSRIMTSIPDAPEDKGLVPGAGHPGPEVNVGPFERGLSVTLGTALVALALARRRAPASPLVAALGAYLAWRGTTGHCALYEALDTGTAGDDEDDRLAAGGHDDASASASLTVPQGPDEVYAFVRRFENAPRYMAFVASVEELDGVRSRWTARRPGGRTLQWEAEVLEDRPARLVVWRSMPGAPVHHAVAIALQPAPDGGTEVRLDVEYEPPRAPLARALGRLLGSSTEYPAADDLRRLGQELQQAAP